MRSIVITLQLATALAHYGDPNTHGCESDELKIQIQGIPGNLCSPECDASGSCPTDVPAGATATPECALSASTGEQYCALICDPTVEASDTQCGENASCKPGSASSGICTYDDMPLPPSSAHWAPVNSPTFDALSEVLSVAFDKTGQIGFAGAATDGIGPQIVKSVDAGVTCVPDEP